MSEDRCISRCLETNVADYLSRSPLPIEQKEEICYQNTEEYIQSVVLGEIASALTAREVELDQVRSTLLRDNWSNVPQS